MLTVVFFPSPCFAGPGLVFSNPRETLASRNKPMILRSLPLGYRMLPFPQLFCDPLFCSRCRALEKGGKQPQKGIRKWPRSRAEESNGRELARFAILGSISVCCPWVNSCLHRVRFAEEPSIIKLCNLACSWGHGLRCTIVTDHCE